MIIPVTEEMVDAFGVGWQSVGTDGAPLAPGTRRRAGLAAAMPLIEAAFEEKRSRTTTTRDSRGQLAYTAYGRSTGFKNHQGEPMPSWDGLSAKTREAWVFSANVIWDLATTGHASL